MARLSDLPASVRAALEGLDCPRFDTDPWVDGPPLAERRVAIVSTAGLHHRGERPFTVGASDYRVIDGEVPVNELVMSHVSTNFDRSGFQQDVNVVFPIERLRELAAQRRIGSVATYHYSFMGATAPEQMASTAAHLAPMLAADDVDAILLAPV